MKGKKVKKLIALVAAVTVAAGSMAGCSGKEKETKKEEKIANIAMSSEPDNIDGSRGDSSAKGAIILEVQESLLRMDENGETQPAGAFFRGRTDHIHENG